VKTTGINESQKLEMLQMHKDGKTTKEIAQHFRIKESICYYYISEEKKKAMTDSEVSEMLESILPEDKQDKILELELEIKRLMDLEQRIATINLEEELTKVQNELAVSNNLLHIKDEVIENLHKEVEAFKSDNNIKCTQCDKENQNKGYLEERITDLINNNNVKAYKIKELESELHYIKANKIQDESIYKNYSQLKRVLNMALDQAAVGKGKERHANEEAFENQKICTLSRQIGSNHGLLFQATKKVIESARLPANMAISELLGAMNYCAAAVILLEEQEKKMIE
jgi:hypothetical protein